MRVILLDPCSPEPHHLPELELQLVDRPRRHTTDVRRPAAAPTGEVHYVTSIATANRTAHRETTGSSSLLDRRRSLKTGVVSSTIPGQRSIPSGASVRLPSKTMAVLHGFLGALRHLFRSLATTHDVLSGKTPRAGRAKRFHSAHTPRSGARQIGWRRGSRSRSPPSLQLRQARSRARKQGLPRCRPYPRRHSLQG